MYIVITTKKTETVRVLGPQSWSPTWCGPSISSLMIGISWLDGSLIVKLFKQRWQCFAAEQSAMSSVDFHLWHHYSVIVLRSLLFIIMALFGHKLCTYRSEESLEFQLEPQFFSGEYGFQIMYVTSRMQIEKKTSFTLLQSDFSCKY